MTDREEFEKTINIHCRRINEHGDYIMGETQDAWSGFQLGRASMQSDVAGLKAMVNELRIQLNRVIGMHCAPSDCYSTGPLSGDALTDMSCPSCEGEELLAILPAQPLVSHDAEIKKAERERCAKICDNRVDSPHPSQWTGQDCGAKECAEAIRSTINE